MSEEKRLGALASFMGALTPRGVALLVVILVGTTALVTVATDTGDQFTDAAAATTAVRAATE